MRFYDGKNANDSIIESIKEYNNYYEVKFLYDDDSYLINKKEKDVKLEMLLQAQQRDEELYKKYNKAIVEDIGTYGLSVLATALATNGNAQFLSCFLFVASIYFCKSLRKDLRKHYELKKYHIFLDIRKELLKPENKDILDVIEYDKYFQDPRGIVIENLDHYSCSEMKDVKKELKRRNK